MAGKQRLESGLGPIVSSAHLTSGAMPALSELEFGMILLDHAFERWMVRCMAAAGVPDMSPLDVLVFHTIAHRGKAKRVADICLVLMRNKTFRIAKRPKARSFLRERRAPTGAWDALKQMWLRHFA
jgi:predicted MarR family transcription regulator